MNFPVISGQVANIAEGEAECCICHETLCQVLYFTVQQKYTVLLLIYWFCIGGRITYVPLSLLCNLSSGLREYILRDAKNKQNQLLVHYCCPTSENQMTRKLDDVNFDFQYVGFWVYIHVCIHMYILIFVHLYTYTHAYITTYILMYVHVYTAMFHIHTYIILF